MITARIEITKYFKDSNTCEARLLNGDLIQLDPFVGCAIKLSDDDYEAGEGNDVVGKSYILTLYSVYSDVVVPHEDGMIEL